MILEFVQKALLKNEKTSSILIKDEKLKSDILTGNEITTEILNKVFNKSVLKRKDFTKLEEVIKLDLDKKIVAINETVELFDIISEDFKRFDKTTIKNRLLKKEYLYITGKTLYEHLINRKENALEQIKQNRLLLFLDMPYKDWNLVENLCFEKYFCIPVTYFYAVFFKNAENTINTGKLAFNDKLEKVEFERFDQNFSLRAKFTGMGAEIDDFYRFDLDDEKHNSPCIIFIPNQDEKIVKGNIIIFQILDTRFFSHEAVFIKAKNDDDLQNIISNQLIRNKVGISLYNNLPISNLDANIDYPESQSQINLFYRIAGQYICFTIGKEKDRIRSQKLIINNDCTVHFSSTTLHLDTGFANISDAEKILQIHFHFEDGEFKYNLLLHLNNTDIKAGKLQGVVCGINRLNEPFAERVFLVRTADSTIEPEDYQLGTDKLFQLIERFPELLAIFLGKENDFGTDFEALQVFHQNFYLPKQQNIARICGVFEVFVYDAIRESIRKSVFQILPNGEVLIKLFEKGQTYHGKAEILQPDILIINISKSLPNSIFHGLTISLLDGYEIEGIQNFVAFFSGKNEKNELITIRQVFVKSNLEFDSIEPLITPINTKEFDALNSVFNGVGNYLSGKTNNILKSKLTINHNLKRETDFGQLYFESACYSATHQDKTRAIQQLQNAFTHGFRNKELLTNELQSGNLQLINDAVDVGNLKMLV